MSRHGNHPALGPGRGQTREEWEAEYGGPVRPRVVEADIPRNSAPFVATRVAVDQVVKSTDKDS